MAKAKTTTSKAIVPWDEKFAKYAKTNIDRAKDIGSGGGVSIKFGAGTIYVSGTPMPEGKLRCVVLDWCFLNAWYKEAYDANDPQPPDCYALGTDYEELAPGKSVEYRQADLCANCDLNAYGSAANGRGKACGNNVRLALLTEGDLEPEQIAMAEVAIARVSPTNLKAWAAYVDALSEDFGRPPWAVLTEISSHPHEKNQIRLEFKLARQIEKDDVLMALERRFAKAQDILQKPYGPKVERATPPPAKGSSRKFAGKKSR